VRYATTIIIGAGQSGLAMSKHLTGYSIDHVLLERGEVANSWQRERWDSLRLLTPNWQSRLPGYVYEGNDPDGYMSMPEIVDYLKRYASLVGAPVQSGTLVTRVCRVDGGYEVTPVGAPGTVARWLFQAVPAISPLCQLSRRTSRVPSSA